MKNKNLTLLLLSIVVALFINCGKISYDVTIPEQRVQDILNKKFPVTKNYAEISDVTLSNPVLNLGNKRDRLTIGLDAKITQPQTGAQLSDGKIVFSSGLKFDNSTGEFLINDVTVDSVQLDLGNLNEQIKSGIKEFISSELKNNVEGATLYRLDPQNKSTPIAKRFISKVSIRNKSIVVTLTLNE